MDLNKFFKELKRRHVIRETIAYIIGAWVILQVLSLILPIFNAPQWILKALTVFLILGIPLVMVISWVYEITNKGFQRMSELEGKLSPSNHKRRLNAIIIVSALIAVSLFVAIGTKIKTMDEAPPFSIAIMPFKNLSPNEENNWFIDGLRADIWDRLIKIEGMTPISNRSAEKLNNGLKTNQEIMDELHIRYLLEGTVREDKDLAIIDLQLWDNEGKLVWSYPYVEPMDELLRLQKMLSRDVVTAMNFKIGPKEENVFETSETDNLDAYLKVQEGVLKIRNNRYFEAIPYFQDALSLDSLYANAYANLAYAFTSLGWHYTENFYNDIEATKIYAKKALDLDPENARAHTVLGILYSGAELNPKLMDEYLQKALKFSPNDPIENYEAALSYRLNIPTDFEKSLLLFERAFKLEPLDHKNGRELMDAYLLLHRYDEAIGVLNRMTPLIDKEGRGAYMARIESYQVGSWSPILEFWLNELKNDSLNPSLHTRLAVDYDWYFDDNKMLLKHAKRAYELEERKIVHYINALIDNKKFDEVPKLFKTEAFKKQSIARQGMCHFNYLYRKGDMEALKSLMDSTDYYNISPINRIFYKIKIGEIKEPSDIDKITMMQFSLDDKTRIYAEMGNRDSLYACLNDPAMFEYCKWVNSSTSMDPYRNDPEYIAFEKRYMLNSRE